MKVCAINTDDHRGGAAKIASILNREFNSSELPVKSTLFHCGHARKDTQSVGLRRIASRQINAGLFRSTGGRLSFDFGVSRTILNRASEFDIVHLHNLHGYYVDYKHLLLNLRDRPIVWTWHDMWGATGRCGFSFSCDGWKTGCNVCPHLDYYPSTWYDRASNEYREKSALFMDHPNLTIVSPSQWLSDIAIQRGYSRDSVLTIPNPVDLQLFTLLDKTKTRRDLGLDPEAFYLLFVAADCSDIRKGFEDFRRIVSELGVRGIAVGEPPRTACGGILHTGRLNNTKVLNQYYCAADAFVMTSLIDNYPNTVIEAQACGTPVFGYNVGGVPEQMPEFWPGTIKSQDPDELISSVRLWIENRASGDGLAGKLRDFAVTTWNPRKAAASYAEVYGDALRKSGAR